MPNLFNTSYIMDHLHVHVQYTCTCTVYSWIVLITLGKGLTMVAAALEGNFTEKMAECIAARQVCILIII